jgi:hypothetical protein
MTFKFILHVLYIKLIPKTEWITHSIESNAHFECITPENFLEFAL